MSPNAPEAGGADTSRRGLLRLAAAAPLVAMIAAPAAANGTASFDRRLAEYRAARAKFLRLSIAGDDDGALDACEVTADALDALLDEPSPSIFAFATKVEMVLSDYDTDDVPWETLKTLAADARRVAGGAA